MSSRLSNNSKNLITGELFLSRGESEKKEKKERQTGTHIHTH